MAGAGRLSAWNACVAQTETERRPTTLSLVFRISSVARKKRREREWVSSKTEGWVKLDLGVRGGPPPCPWCLGSRASLERNGGRGGGLVVRQRRGVGQSECSKAFGLTLYCALTRYCSPARAFAAPDAPLFVTGQQGSPSPRVNPRLGMRARGAQATLVSSSSTVPS